MPPSDPGSAPKGSTPAIEAGTIDAYLDEFEVPRHLCDPISRAELRAPVRLSARGNAFEEASLEAWFRHRPTAHTDPVSRLPVVFQQAHRADDIACELDALREAAEARCSDPARARAIRALRQECGEARQRALPSWLVEVEARAARYGAPRGDQRGRAAQPESRVLLERLAAMVQALEAHEAGIGDTSVPDLLGEEFSARASEIARRARSTLYQAGAVWLLPTALTGALAEARGQLAPFLGATATVFGSMISGMIASRLMQAPTPSNAYRAVIGSGFIGTQLATSAGRPAMALLLGAASMIGTGLVIRGWSRERDIHLWFLCGGRREALVALLMEREVARLTREIERLTAPWEGLPARAA